MNMSGVGRSITQNSVEDKSTDTEQQIQKLEKKKAKLVQDMQEEFNPLALKQSKNYDALKKQIEQLDNQIQQLKATANKARNLGSEGSNPKESLTNGKQKKPIFNNIRRFDEFVQSQNKSNQDSSGIYSIRYDENGNPVITFDQPKAQEDSKRKDEIEEIE